MKSRETFKKALPILGVGAIATFGSIFGTSVVCSNNNSVSNCQQNQIINKSNKITKTSKSISTINGQKIVDAINSFKLNPSMTNTSQAYQFYYNEGETADSALIKDIKQNIKYVKYYDQSKVYTLPDAAIQVVPTSQYGNYNIQINLSLVDGAVIYYNYFNPSANDTLSESSVSNSNIVVERNSIQFNALTYNNVNEARLQSAKKMETLQIVSITSGVVGGIGIILLIVLLIKRKMANKFAY